MSERNALLEVLLAVEHLNRRSGEAVATGNASANFNGLVDLEIERLKRSKKGWTNDAALIAALTHAGLAPSADEHTLSSVDQLLRWGSASGPNEIPRRLPAATQLTSVIHLYDVGRPPTAISTRQMRFPAKVESFSATLHMVEDMIDPIPTLAEYVVRELVTRDGLVLHVLQEWIQSTFKLADSEPMRDVIGDICRRLNQLFFGAAQPTRFEVQSRESALIGTPLLLTVIEEALHGVSRDEAARAAIGVYALLRLARILRPYRVWLSHDSFASLKQQNPAIKSPEVLDAVTALRAFESGFFKNRAFGAQTTIKGLAYVFKGGMLLPTRRGHVTLLSGPAGSGKSVFAIQSVADVALRGGFGVYLSFEESTGALFERLRTFGLLDDTRFQVLTASIDTFNDDVDLQKVDTSKGLLVLVDCAQPERSDAEDPGRDPTLDQEFDDVEEDPLLETFITQIATKFDRQYANTALVIDSLNVLPFASNEVDAEFAPEIARRIALRNLLDRIRLRKIRCLAIGELPTDGSLERAAYLADTVIEMGWNQTHARRFLEISKCRTQDYHPGAHLYRISDGRGARLYPSLAAIRSTIRKRGRASLREPRTVLKVNQGTPHPLTMLASRSILLSGPPGTGKSKLALELVVSPAYSRETEQSGPIGTTPPRGVLALTFSTPEFGFERRLEHFGHATEWNQLPFQRVRWYSPGESLSGGQILADLQSVLTESMRVGCPIERILIDDLEAAEYFLPSIQQEMLFWPTLIEYTATEGLTTVFVVRTDRFSASSLESIRQAVDYSVEMIRDGDMAIPYVEKDNGVWMKPYAPKTLID